LVYITFICEGHTRYKKNRWSLPAQLGLVVDLGGRSLGLATHGGHDTHVDGDAAEKVHHEEEQEDAAECDTHDGRRGEDLSLSHLDDIDSYMFFFYGSESVQTVAGMRMWLGETSVLH